MLATSASLIRSSHFSIHMMVTLFVTFAALLVDSSVHISIQSFNMPLNAITPNLAERLRY
jgi:hypothetical protein